MFSWSVLYNKRSSTYRDNWCSVEPNLICAIAELELMEMTQKYFIDPRVLLRSHQQRTELHNVILSAEIFPDLKCVQWINITNDPVRDAKYYKCGFQ